jgi:hypothetical protein
MSGCDRIQAVEHFNFKGDAATDKAKRLRARKVIPTLGKCDKCPAKAVDRHHKDGNTGNNERSNLERLCRRCHMIVDGRLNGLAKARAARKPKPDRPCRICGRLSKRLSKGRCHRCEEYLRRNGIEWTPASDHRFGKRAPEHVCDNCKRPVPVGWSKGRCPACRLYLKKHGHERSVKAQP